jgi:hypothetical protein
MSKNSKTRLSYQQPNPKEPYKQEYMYDLVCHIYHTAYKQTKALAVASSVCEINISHTAYKQAD